MNTHRWVAALAAVGLLALAWPVRAQVGADGTKYTAATGMRMLGVQSDSTQSLLRMNAAGAAKVEDVTSEWNYLAFNHALFSDTMAVGAFQDSSLFVETGNAEQLYLKLRATIPTGTPANMFVRLAVQVRQADENPSTADTALVTLWQPTVAVGAATTAGDSLAYSTGGRAATGGDGVASGNAVAGSSEFVVTLYDFKNVAVSSVASAFTSARIPLADNRGVWAWAPYTQVRVRVLACGTGNTPIITASLVGRP